MASLLYREGKGHFVGDVECEMILVEYDQYEAMLSAGWSPDVPGEKPVEKAIDAKDLSDADSVREAARKAGIEGWDTKRISTLRGLLEA